MPQWSIPETAKIVLKVEQLSIDSDNFRKTSAVRPLHLLHRSNDVISNILMMDAGRILVRLASGDASERPHTIAKHSESTLVLLILAYVLLEPGLELTTA
eukprot:scaffold266177_cov23-Prasinocladus_malaysianus.AAC.1